MTTSPQPPRRPASRGRAKQFASHDFDVVAASGGRGPAGIVPCLESVAREPKNTRRRKADSGPDTGTTTGAVSSTTQAAGAAPTQEKTQATAFRPLSEPG